MGKRVIILGGGIGGLSAAHELIDRGYEVHVYEKGDILGGKARSQFVPGTGTNGRRDLPGEHGFRFYPRFYRHLIDTMERTPLSHDASKNVAQNLRETTESAIAAVDDVTLVRFYRRSPPHAYGILQTIELFFADMDVDPVDVGIFALKVIQYFTSSAERRLKEYEKISWWEFLGGPGYSTTFQRYLRAIPRTMVAMDPRAGNARTIGDISMQLLLDFATEGVNNDRTMSGPTSEMWLDHWQAHLENKGVVFHLGKPTRGFHFDGHRITGVDIEGESAPVTGDHYVAALPIEVASRLITPDMARFDPALYKIRSANLDWLTAWMVGVQFFLYEDVPMVRGHVFYPDSPWALTSISQAQFWRDHGLFRKRYGNGEVGGCISVDIADWNTPGIYVPKRARDCTRDEVIKEVWEQVKAGINAPGAVVLDDNNLHSAHIDADLYPPDGSLPPENHSRLLVHPPGSWDLRPEAATRIPNLFLASDFVRTYTDLATMEGANEAARRAVAALLERDGSTHGPPMIMPLEEPAELEPLKKLDRRLLDAGKPHLFELLRVNDLFHVADVLRRLSKATGLSRLDDILDEYRATRLIESALRRLGLLPRGAAA